MVSESQESSCLCPFSAGIVGAHCHAGLCMSGMGSEPRSSHSTTSTFPTEPSPSPVTMILDCFSLWIVITYDYLSGFQARDVNFSQKYVIVPFFVCLFLEEAKNTPSSLHLKSLLTFGKWENVALSARVCSFSALGNVLQTLALCGHGVTGAALFGTHSPASTQ